MKLVYTALVTFAILSTAGYGLPGEDEKPLSSHLKPLAAYLGKTYKGEFAGSTPEKPVYDIARWERALNGKAIRITHSVNNGQYGGESIVMWDPKKKSLTSWYFTTAGFFTQATITIEKNKLIAHEKVTGNQNGITEVRSTTGFLPGGEMKRKAEFLQKGKWVPGHSIHYKEAPDAKVIFK